MKIEILEIIIGVVIILKLTGHIDLSWWWILCPIWIPLALAGLIWFWVWFYEKSQERYW